MHVVIVGGVAGGASCSTRLRRLNENIDITLVDKGEYVSFANCGLPYRVGNVVDSDSKLLIATPKLFKDRFNIDVKVNTTVKSIDRKSQLVAMVDNATNEETLVHYDKLVISTGARAIVPNTIPGLKDVNTGKLRDGVFVLKTIPDAQQVKNYIEKNKIEQAVVVGGGFIGLEIAENLHHLGINVTILEKSPQLLPPIDQELANILAERIEKIPRMNLVLGDGLQSVESVPSSSQASSNLMIVKTENGKSLPSCGLMMLCIGVRPENELCINAGLAVGASGGVIVNSRMQTMTDPNIFAVGDVVEDELYISHERMPVALAGNASKQGHIVADNIAGIPSVFRGSQATSVVSAFGLVVASTGMTEKALQRLHQGISGSPPGKKNYAGIYLHPGHHVSYFPDAKELHIKLLFNTNGFILGCQIVGEEGVDKRVDVVAMAIQMKANVKDLAEAELCYSPQFGHAKDPINMAGMLAQNVIQGLVNLGDWSNVVGPFPPPSRTSTENEKEPQSISKLLLLDVRSVSEFQKNRIPDGKVRVVNIPLEELRTRHTELSRDEHSPIMVTCAVGQRGYYACRFLAEMGFSNVFLLSGGLKTYQQIAFTHRQLPHENKL